MSIKSYLRTLFKMSGSQSAPNANNYVQIQIPQGESTYTAPADGYVSFALSGTGLMRLSVDGQCESCIGIYGGNVNSVSSSQWLRVNKGDVVKFRVETLDECFWARFVRTVGGGEIPDYQALERRCSPCLRLSRSFELLENPLQGFRSRPRQTELSASRTLRATLHQAMGGLFSTTIPKVKAISASMQLSEAKCSVDPTCLREKTRASQSISLFVKVWKFGKTVKRRLRFTSSRATAFNLIEQEVRYGFA